MRNFRCDQFSRSQANIWMCSLCEHSHIFMSRVYNVHTSEAMDAIDYARALGAFLWHKAQIVLCLGCDAGTRCSPVVPQCLHCGETNTKMVLGAQPPLTRRVPLQPMAKHMTFLMSACWQAPAPATPEAPVPTTADTPPTQAPPRLLGWCVNLLQL